VEPDVSPIHRTGDGDRIAGSSWESLTERLIREAQERGEFDDLPFQGERIPLEDDSAAGELALGFHMLRNAGIAPPWIEADKDVRRLLEKRAALVDRARREGRVSERLRREFESLIATLNRSIDVLNWEAPTHGVQRRRLDAVDELRSLEEAARSG
jgi:hypothetical protein